VLDRRGAVERQAVRRPPSWVLLDSASVSRVDVYECEGRLAPCLSDANRTPFATRY